MFGVEGLSWGFSGVGVRGVSGGLGWGGGRGHTSASRVVGVVPRQPSLGLSWGVTVAPLSSHCAMSVFDEVGSRRSRRVGVADSST